MNNIRRVRSNICNHCRRHEIIRGSELIYSKIVYDLKLTYSGIKRWVTKLVSVEHKCLNCKKFFNPLKRHKFPIFEHGLKSWVVYNYVQNRVNFEQIKKIMEDVFGMSFKYKQLCYFRYCLFKYYKRTAESLLRKILKSEFVHIDETQIKLKRVKAYVWVFTTMDDVVFLFRPDRDADFLKELLRGYGGVVISDFYAGYDSLNCKQQKCLAHLIRDLNEDLQKNPYNKEYKEMLMDFLKQNSIIT